MDMRRLLFVYSTHDNRHISAVYHFSFARTIQVRHRVNCLVQYGENLTIQKATALIHPIHARLKGIFSFWVVVHLHPPTVSYVHTAQGAPFQLETLVQRRHQGKHLVIHQAITLQEQDLLIYHLDPTNFHLVLCCHVQLYG